MENNHTITSGDFVALLTVWGLATAGCLAVLDEYYSGSFTLFFDELVLVTCAVAPLIICVALAVVSILFILFNLFFSTNPPVPSADPESSRSTMFQPGSGSADWLVTFVIFIVVCCVLLELSKSNVLGSIILTSSTVLLLVMIYKTSSLTKIAKITAIPAIIFFITPFVLMPFRDFSNMKKTYIMDTTISDMNSVIIASAKKKGDFAEITTKDGRYYRININTITRIRENKESSEGAAKAPQPAEQK